MRPKKQNVLLISLIVFFLFQPTSIHAQSASSDRGAEFLKQPRSTYTTAGNPKADQLVIRIQYPASWSKSEDERPDVVQKFVSERAIGKDTVFFKLVVVRLPDHLTQTTELAHAFLNEQSLKELMGPDGILISQSRTTVDGLPGAWLIYRRDYNLAFRTLVLTYWFYYERRLVGCEFMLGGKLDEPAGEFLNRFYEGTKLFRAMMASVVVENQWRSVQGGAPDLRQTRNNAEPPPPPPLPDGSSMRSVIRKSGGTLQGSATQKVQPNYPPMAKAARVAGAVVVEVLVDEAGNVVNAQALSGHPLLKDEAVTAAMEWKFTPTQVGGVPVKVIGTITFNFTL